jgi:hypothetical protein
MPALRFVTARDLFEAFPIALDELNVESSDAPSLDFMKSLADQGALDKAIGFCAFLLPRRQAVWWAAQCIRIMIAVPARDEMPGLQVAEAWVQDPEEDRRLAALKVGQESSPKLATTWVALAAGWAGPTMPAAEGGTTPILPYQTARAVRAAVLIAGCRPPMVERDELLRKCLANGASLAVGDNPRL